MTGRVRLLALLALASIVLTVVATGSGAHGDTFRASLPSDPAQEANDDSVDASINGNGNFVVFKSTASNLTPTADANGAVADVYLRDRAAGTTSLVSVDPTGAQFSVRSEEPTISSDGGTAAWVSGGQVYVRTLPNGPVQLVSKASDGTPGDFGSHEPALSADGNLVAFWSNANNLVPGDAKFTGDVFVYNRTTGAMELESAAGLSGTAPGSQVGQDSNLPSISGGGRYVVFQSQAPFVTGDTNGKYDIYVRDRQTGTLTLVSHAPDGTAGNDNSFEGNGGPVISKDGTTIAFASNASNLVGGDTNNDTDVFVFHVATGTVERASVTTDGTQGVGGSSRPDINADGTFVAFQSAAVLQRFDTNTDTDVYVRHLGEHPARTTLESASAQGQIVSGNKFAPSINGDGTLVAYHSAAGNLVQNDSNSRYDVFVHELGIADTTPPSVTGTPATSPNADGWYNQNVLVHWAAVDPEPSSGQPATPPDSTVSTEGKNVTATSAPACDGNSNCATGSVTVSIDKTGPAVTTTLNKPNANGWYSNDVVVGFTCSDALSGIASCPAPVHLETEGANQTVPAAQRTATDRAGNASVAAVAPVNVDQTLPTISFTGVQRYDIDGTVSITCAAADALSGIASSNCANVRSPAYLFNVGPNTVTATVTDKAGNVATKSFTFTIAPTSGGIQKFTCALLGSGKELREFCQELTDDLDNARKAGGRGDGKKRDQVIREYLKEASDQVGKLITTAQMVTLARVAQSVNG
jgi:Tol biopolymer transport system component